MNLGEPWAAIKVGYLQHPRLVGAPADVVLVHLAAILYAVEYRTDGRVPDIIVRGRNPSKRVLDEVQKRELLVRSDDGESWQVHDFADYQRLRDGWDAERSMRSERARHAALMRWNRERGNA